MGSLDILLRKRHEDGRPINVGLVGAGTMGRAIGRHLLTPVTGIRLVAISNRTIDKAKGIFRDSGCDQVLVVETLSEIEDSLRNDSFVVTEDPKLLCKPSLIDVIVEVTGTVDFAAHVALEAFDNRKHVVLVNAELDSTLGPILKVYADRAGVVVTNTDGDEPGVAMTLLRYLRSIGLKPVAAGNLKGMIDHYRTPSTQREFAARFHQDPAKATSFADGTKLCMEATVLANASGFRVGQRGMYGVRCSHVRDIAALLPADQLLEGGLIDYALGAEPHTGAFVIVHEEQPNKRGHLEYFKMGPGPFFVFYTPYHLPHMQVVSTIASAVLHHDATVTPLGPPMCQVATVAKRPLKAGETLDGTGGFTVYGAIENSDIFFKENLLPIGLSDGCRLLRDIPRDSPVHFSDVERPPGRLCDTLWAKQVKRFFHHPA